MTVGSTKNLLIGAAPDHAPTLQPGGDATAVWLSCACGWQTRREHISREHSCWHAWEHHVIAVILGPKEMW